MRLCGALNPSELPVKSRLRGLAVVYHLVKLVKIIDAKPSLYHISYVFLDLTLHLRFCFGRDMMLYKLVHQTRRQTGFLSAGMDESGGKTRS